MHHASMDESGREEENGPAVVQCSMLPKSRSNTCGGGVRGKEEREYSTTSVVYY
jgi:hypothetical protein